MEAACVTQSAVVGNAERRDPRVTQARGAANEIGVVVVVVVVMEAERWL